MSSKAEPILRYAKRNLNPLARKDRFRSDFSLVGTTLSVQDARTRVRLPLDVASIETDSTH